MGLYLEPPGVAPLEKEKWIEENGRPIPFGHFLDPKAEEGRASVVLFDNGFFHALAFAFNEKEAERLTSRDDGRWYSVESQKVRLLLGDSTWKSI